MSFLANTEEFSGPLDLMLHLIREHKLEVMNLDTEVLTEQYLLYLNKMEEKHLEIESEYLLELATLLEIKSRLLVPKNETVEEVDPRDALVARLLEYQRYKNIAKELENSFMARQNLLAKPLSLIEESSEADKLSGSAYDLYKAMTHLMRKMRLHMPSETKLIKREISLEECILKLKAKLVHLPKTFNLGMLLEDSTNTYEFVLSFLAILVLVHENILFFTVTDKEIWFKRGNEYGN